MDKIKILGILHSLLGGFFLCIAGFIAWNIYQLYSPAELFASLDDSFMGPHYKFEIFLVWGTFIGVLALLIINMVIARSVFNHFISFKKSITIIVCSVLFLALLPLVYKGVNNSQTCQNMFVSCSYVWHEEKNKFGHIIDVHTLMDSKGNKLGAEGMGYRGGMKEYDEVLMSIPGVTSQTDPSGNKIYIFPSGNKAVLQNHDTTPQLDMQNLSLDEQSLVNQTIFSIPGYVSPILGGEGKNTFEVIQEVSVNDHKEKKDYSINTEAEWKKLFTTTSPVDFSTSTVLAVFYGEKATGGFNIRVKDIKQTDKELVVTVEEKRPGSSCLTTQAFTNPYQMVKIEKTVKEITFVHEEKVTDCE